MMTSQTTSHLLLVRPAAFGYNPVTATSNNFQKAGGDPSRVQAKALAEFDRLVNLLNANSLDVNVINDSKDPVTPDAVFPNNWISFIDGQITLYPMEASNRRPERRKEIVGELAVKWRIGRINDLSPFENTHHFLEGTGSIVPDRVNRIAYACLSPRTDPLVLAEFCRQMNYNSLTFHAFDLENRPIYHTNVMMCLGSGFVVICLEAIPDENERYALLRSFRKTAKTVVAISVEQMNAFAGNMLEVCNRKGERLVILSERAFRSLSTEQTTALERYARLVHSPLDTIEDHGGGSARCMIAEIFPP